MTGRPTKLTADIANYICEQLAEGRSLRSICGDEGMPAVSTVMLWVVDDREGFSEQYMRAREAAGFSHADRILDTIDRAANGEYEPNQARVIMDGLKWAAERMAPKKHSPRQEVTGKEGEPVQTESTVKADQLDNETLAKLMAAKQNDGDSPDTD